MKRLFSQLFLAALLLTGTSSFRPGAGTGYPHPDGIRNLLFYTQRSTNINTIVYELNLAGNNEINEKEPIKAYWINYATDGSREPLNLIERKKAYGVESELTDAEKKTFRFSFVSYKQKPLYLMRSPADNKYHAFCYINNNLIMISRVFIQTEEGLLGTPKIKHIDILGVDPTSQEPVSERIKP